jgi:hypothetical protein
VSAHLRELARIEHELAATQRAVTQWQDRAVAAQVHLGRARTVLENVTASGGTAEALGEAQAAADGAYSTAVHARRRLQALTADMSTLAAEQAAMRDLSRQGATAAGTPARPPRAVADAPGHDLCPDPLTARTAAELTAALRRYRIWAGEPSYREMARLCGGKIGASTLNTALRSDELPALPVVLAVITACGGSEEDQRGFATAWRELRLAQEDGDQQAAPPLRALRPVSAAVS